MDKDEALRLALEYVELVPDDRYNAEHIDQDALITAIKAVLEANEFNPDWDTQAVLTEEIQRMAKRIEELEAKDEPVGWLHKETGLLRKETISSKGADWDENHWKPLYTTPPQRTWVGLTEEEVADIERNSITRRQAIRAIEAKLKEKNT